MHGMFKAKLRGSQKCMVELSLFMLVKRNHEEVWISNAVYSPFLFFLQYNQQYLPIVR